MVHRLGEGGGAYPICPSSLHLCVCVFVVNIEGIIVPIATEIPWGVGGTSFTITHKCGKLTFRSSVQWDPSTGCASQCLPRCSHV